MRKIMILLLIFGITMTAFARSIPDNANHTLRPADQIINDNDDLPEVEVLRSDKFRYSLRRDPIIGEVTQVGDTYYDYQSNGAINKFISVDASGNVHVTWMDAFYSDLNQTRKQKYSYYSAENDEWTFGDDGLIVDEGDRSGYGSLWHTNHDLTYGIVFSHVSGGPYDDDFQAYAAIDFYEGAGAFLPTLLPRFPEFPIAWPQGVMSPDDKVHAIANYFDPHSHISYVSGLVNEFSEIEFEQEVPIAAAQSHLNSYRIARSQVSERVVIGWMKPRVGLVAPEEWEGFAAYQMNNDLMIAWTDDGEDWNFDSPYNVTKTLRPDANMEGDEIFGDTLLPYNNFDLIFDEDDNIHVVFQARGMWWNPTLDSSPPLGNEQGSRRGLTIDDSYLFHWDEATLEFSLVADGWYGQGWIEDINDDGVDDTTFASNSAWKSNVCYPSLAYGEDGLLYCVYNYYPAGDFSLDVTSATSDATCHGDVHVTVSEDNGASWYYPTKIVETYSHLAENGDAESECYPTVAERVDDYLHILYEVDTQAGTPIQDGDEGAIATLCPIIYLKVPVEDILMDSTLADTVEFHVDNWIDVADEPSLSPHSFELTSVYPNPFNSSTAIDFSIERTQLVKLEIVDVGGRRVTELLNGELLAGGHTFTWEAMNIPAGIYFVKLTAGQQNAVKKIALIK